MGDIIKLLPDSIANQIAAGEVVQRPASVVKELLENSIDASSTSIDLIIRDAGSSLIQVIDNGSGMTENDARMCFERHATSKIKKAEDLFQLSTMGFRGEALPSIASVSQVELKTQKKDDTIGCYLYIEGSQIKKQEPTVISPGTQISVKNLFFNVPARRNFLKSHSVENRHILDEFQRIALSYPSVHFQYINDNQKIFQLKQGKLLQRIAQLFGKNIDHQLVNIHEETPSLNVSGYIGKPELARKARGNQFFYVNNRFIKSAYLNHSIQSAYEGMIDPENFPFFVIFMEIPPQKIDVNVHPTKTEIKFEDEKLIYNILKASVRKSLGVFQVIQPLDFATDVNFNQSIIPFSETRKDTVPSQNQYWKQAFESVQDEKYGKKDSTEKDSFQYKTVSSKISNGIFHEVLSSSPPVSIHHQFVLKQVASGLLIIDQKKAQERIIFEQTVRKSKEGKNFAQHCLFPKTIELNVHDFLLYEEIKDDLQLLGFEISIMGKSTIAVNGIPTEAVGQDEQVLLDSIFDQYRQNQQTLSVGAHENLARVFAKRISSRFNQKLELEEMNKLIDLLFACDQPNYTPDGYPTHVIWTMEKIIQLFNR